MLLIYFGFNKNFLHFQVVQTKKQTETAAYSAGKGEEINGLCPWLAVKALFRLQPRFLFKNIF